MRFALDDGQVAFGQVLGRMFAAADVPAAVRAWGRGEHGPGLALWRRAVEADVFALAAPQGYGGLGPLPVELGVAFVESGRHCVPGPLVETVAVTALLVRLAESGEQAPAKEWVPRLCTGRARATLAAPAGGPYALDADAADAVFSVTGIDGTTDGGAPAWAYGRQGPDTTAAGAGGRAELRLAPGHGPVRASLDPARRLARPSPGGELLAAGPAVRDAAAHAADWAAFATAAQALGVGLALLDRTVAYAGQRVQFGRPIGSFQAVKHRLADTLIGLEFARPLLYGAAVALAARTPDAPAAVAAAKVAACEAAYAAARSALQVHGAIGYTAEYDLSLWIGKARALLSAWGGPEDCRRKVLHM
ncbi:acyl-CoA dehydrogenase family protein [Streptomyces sp. NPDC026206]|uniref:acyl-CoA dehydrogenase family protein n=1 Tax=Streptomyces sp. NPDC026206 TaxID=3157089 RepID=UPI0033C95D0E